jgi:hypothetical protein
VGILQYLKNSKQNNSSGPKYKSGDFTKYNPKKYCGEFPIKYRSSYELLFMFKMEANNNVEKWASEQIVVPYLLLEKNPKTGKFEEKRHNYITDFTVYLKDGSKYIVEVKPLAFTPLNESEVRRNPTQYKNMQKWKYAMRWCKQNGFIFKVVNEQHLKTKIF